MKYESYAKSVRSVYTKVSFIRLTSKCNLEAFPSNLEIKVSLCPCANNW